MTNDSMICYSVDILQSCKVHSQFFLYYWQSFEDLCEAISLEDHYILNIIDLCTVNVEFCDDANGSLATNKKLFKIVSSIIFMYLRSKIQYFSIRHYSLQS